MKKVATFTVQLIVDNKDEVSGRQIADFAQRIRGEGYGWFRRWKHRGTVTVNRIMDESNV